MTQPTRNRPFVLRALAAGALALTLAAATAGSASAGGWAVGSLDEAPSGDAGVTEDVGFTILQHGQTPVDMTEDVGIDIVGANGFHEFFAATGTGTVGHYVASVTFPEAGSYTWSIRMGMFEPQLLGTLELTAPPAPPVAPPPPESTAWSTLRWVLLAATVALLVIALVDLVIHRRRRPHAAPVS